LVAAGEREQMSIRDLPVAEHLREVGIRQRNVITQKNMTASRS
jgi:hypothetical protein